MDFRDFPKWDTSFCMVAVPAFADSCGYESIASRCGFSCGRGDRLRLQLLFKVAGAESTLILAVTVTSWLSPPPPLYSVKKYLMRAV